MTAVSRPRVALAVPRFRATLEQLVGLGLAAPVLPGMQWLASRAHRAAASPGDWRAWLLSRVGPGADMLQRCPAGAAVRALATGAREEGCWACAQPVHLLTGLDHLRLAPLAGLQLSTEEARAIGDSLGAVLAGSGYSLRPFEAGRPWTLACPTDIQCDTMEPAQAEGRDIRDCLPAGRDGAQIRKLMNELQMLLHEHPVNTRRAERGLPPVNSFWLWGFGRAKELEPTQLPTLCTDDPWLQGVWRLHGIAARPLAAAGALETEATLLIAAAGAAADPVPALERWESELGAPLAAALRIGRVRSASIRLGDVSYTVSSADRFAVWRRRRTWTELLA